MQQQPRGPEENRDRLWLYSDQGCRGRHRSHGGEAFGDRADCARARPLRALLLLQGPPIPPVQRPHEAHQGTNGFGKK